MKLGSRNISFATFVTATAASVGMLGLLVMGGGCASSSPNSVSTGSGGSGGVGNPLPIRPCPEDVSVGGGGGCGGPPRAPIPLPTVTFTPTPGPTICPAWGCGGPPIIGPIAFNPSADSLDGATKDVDQQEAQLQANDSEAEAQSISTRFQMNIDSARQLTTVANQMNQLASSAQGLTDEDRQALAQKALGVAGISMDQVNAAIAESAKGNPGAYDAIVEQAATNLGMTSTELRDQLLPTLGLHF